jgi:transcriptional regulator with XRE-family HTH domain
VARFNQEMSAADGAQPVAEYGRRHRMAGDRMRQARRASGYTQQRLAAELGIPVWRLSRYELGLTPIPPRLLLKMADHLELPVTEEQPAGRVH